MACTRDNFIVLTYIVVKALLNRLRTDIPVLCLDGGHCLVQVSSGAIDMAKANLEKMLISCAAPVERDGTNDDVVNAQQKSLFEVTHELVRQVTSPNTLVREQVKILTINCRALIKIFFMACVLRGNVVPQAMHSLEVLARIQNKTVTEVMEPHKEVLQDMIPPKKHLLRHQPANAQIGIMDGNTFCTTLEPRLFTIGEKQKWKFVSFSAF
jgi:transformation/transcription domain-associated protein